MYVSRLLSAILGYAGRVMMWFDLFDFSAFMLQISMYDFGEGSVLC
jgi:hypothetical protein